MARQARQPITYREIYYEQTSGGIRRFDWNAVNSPLGGGFEPRSFADFFPLGDGGAIPACDVQDTMIRIDKIQFLNGEVGPSSSDPFWRDKDGTLLHGGHLSGINVAAP